MPIFVENSKTFLYLMAKQDWHFSGVLYYLLQLCHSICDGKSSLNIQLHLPFTTLVESAISAVHTNFYSAVNQHVYRMHHY